MKSGPGAEIDAKIASQGDTVRKLKAEKADKASIDAAVKTLLELKAEFKSATGSDWKPPAAPGGGDKKQKEKKSPPPASAEVKSGPGAELDAKIASQGDTVRKLKAEKADKASVDAAVKTLLELKAEYKAATGSDWKPAAAPGGGDKKEK